jgi:hypothetical protein
MWISCRSHVKCGNTSALLFTCAAALWLSMMRYLDYSPRYYSTVLTLRGATPQVWRVDETRKFAQQL